MTPPTDAAEVAGKLTKALEWTENHLVGLEVAADCEARIQASYVPEMALWEARKTNGADALLSRMVRNSLEARDNEKRFRKQVTHLQCLLAATQGNADVARARVENERLRAAITGLLIEFAGLHEDSWPSVVNARAALAPVDPAKALDTTKAVTPNKKGRPCTTPTSIVTS